MTDLDLLALAVLRTGSESAWNAFLDECEERDEWAKAASLWYEECDLPGRARNKRVRDIILDKACSEMTFPNQTLMWVENDSSMAWSRRVRDMLR